MRIRIKRRHIVIAAVNAAALIACGALTFAGSRLAKSQSYNFAAERWKNGSSDSYTQVSCFFTEDAGINVDQLDSLRGQLISKLKEAAVEQEAGKTLCPDAYSADIGKFLVESDDGVGKEAELTAVGGEFFLFHDFPLRSGAFFSRYDVMQDGAVIDRSLAFALYGSDNVAGMDIYINNIRCYISGVIDDPSGKYEKECAGDTARAYVSYSIASQLMGAGLEGEGFSTITCYECVSPDPVEDFGYTSIKEIMENNYGDKAEVVNNTTRFDAKKRAKAAKKLYRTAVKDSTIKYPYWENASRMAEFRVSQLYGARKKIFIIPILTALWLLFILVRAYMKNDQKIKAKVSDILHAPSEKIKRKRYDRLTKESNINNEQAADAPEITDTEEIK